MIDPKPTASHFINGEYVEDKLGKAIDVIYPATGHVIAQVHAATSQILEAALAASKKLNRLGRLLLVLHVVAFCEGLLT